MAVALAMLGLGYAFAARHVTPPENIGFPGYWAILAIGSAGAGLLLALKRPTNPIGWLFLGGAVLWALVQLGDAYATWAVAGSASGSIVARMAAMSLEWIWIPAQASLAIVFTLFPDGRFLSGRWRAWTVSASAGVAVATLTSALTDRPTVYEDVVNPLRVPGMSRIGSIMLAALALLLLIGMANLVVRFHRSRGDERQQIKWLVPSTVAIAAAYLIYVVGFAIPETEPSGVFIRATEAVLLLALATIPLAIAVAVLKYRLYEIDLVLKKTVIFAFLMALLLAAGGLLLLLVAVGVIPSLADSPTLLLLAGIGFGLLAIPLYRIATRIADRVVYAGRESPYQVLSAFSAQIGDAYSNDDVLQRMAGVLHEGTRAEVATVWLTVGGKLVPAACWPPGAWTSSTPPDDAIDVIHQGESLGALSVLMPANDPLDAGRTTLVRDLAAQAGPVLRNVRLIEELKASRQRLVAAQDEERRRLERNIHDGAQQQLVALAVQLRLLEGLAERDPAKARALAVELQSATTSTLEDLRDLARGIYPPLLADKGLPAALKAQARKAAVPTSIRAKGIERYPAATESTIYFCVLEALNNVAKYAHANAATVTLVASNGDLRFTVSDDGVGFDPSATGYGTGLRGMSDRLDAIGGRLEIRSEPGVGTTVAGTIDVGERR